MIPDKAITFLRSLSFGGLLGLGVAWLAYRQNQPYFVGKVIETHFLLFGSALGASVHRAIDSVLRAIMKPLFGHIEYYGKIAQLTHRRDKGRIGDVEYQSLVSRLTVRFFVGEETEGTSKQLSP